MLVLTTSREQPCWWLCILYLCSFSVIDQVSAYSSNNWKGHTNNQYFILNFFYVIFSSQYEHKIVLEPEFMKKEDHSERGA